MSRMTSVRGAFAVLAVLICGPLSAATFTSNQSGDWGNSTTWSPNGVPIAGDIVSITGSHVITVSDTRSAGTVTFLNNSGGKELHVVSGGDLTVDGTLNCVQVHPSTDGTNLLLIDGGVMSVPNGTVGVTGGALSLARVRFSSLGGTLSIGDDLLFSGNSVNAQLQWDAGSNGTIEIGGDLSNNGNVSTAGSSSTFLFNGTGPQTVNGYTFQNLTVDKTGTAALNAPIIVNGALTITNGILDDGGFPISLDSGLASQVSIAGNGVLKLGSQFVATSFPTPVIPANVTLASNSAVVYQSSAPQSIDTSISYQRLYLQKTGAVASAFKDLSGTLLNVFEELFVDATVTVDFDNDILDVNGDINGTGTIQLSNTVIGGTMSVAGDWSSGTLAAANGTTVTYDGSGPQVMLPATYKNLIVNKPSGDLTLTGSASADNNLSLTNGNVVVNGSFSIPLGATVSRISGHFIGPLSMGLSSSPATRFDVGTATSYMPVEIDPSSPGTLIVEAIDGAQPNATGINTLDRYWDITLGTVTNVESILFTYNPIDVTNGTETQFRLAQYNGSNWIDFGDVNDVANTASVGSLAFFAGDWVIGQKGSTGFASQVAITSVNGGVDPTVNDPFDVDVETQHDDGSAANVTSNTTIDVLLDTGTGSLLTATASLTSGTSSGTATGLTYDTVESNVVLNASSSSGDSLTPGTSAPFDVVSLPSTLTVTSTSDTGAGSLRDAITAYNGGGCTIPCTINFGSTGTGNIVLTSQLPALTGGQLTIDGFSGSGAQPNTNAFPQPLDSVITVSIDGNNSVPYGLIIQSANSTIKGLGFRNFNFAASGEAIKIDGVSGCTIAGNYIGTDNSGAADEGNYAGVIINGAGATGNKIGGLNPADRNLISGNVTNGVTIVNANNNEISNNFIGTDANGTAGLGNGGHGVSITGTTANTQIGVLPNRIAFNSLKGIEANTTGIGNVFRTNEIFSNSGIAIDLGTDGPTVNTAGDADTGANNLQNYPDISAAQINGANVDVTLSLDSSLGVNASFFILDVFKADASSPSQAASYLGSSGCLAGVLTNNVVSVPKGSLAVGSKVVATATAYSGAACTGVSEGTSELSPGFNVNGDVHWIAAGGAWENGANWDTGSVPAPGDNAIIDAPGSYTVTLTSGQTVKTLTIGSGISGMQTLQVVTGPLTLNGASSITSTGALELNSGLQGSGTLANNGQFLWNAGTISLAGVTNNTANMTLATAGAKTLIGTTLTNGVAGSILWSGGTVNLGTAGAIANAGMFDTSFDGTLNNAGSGGAFTNSGTFKKSGGAALMTFVNVDLVSSNLLWVASGTVDLANATISGNVDLDSTTILLVNGDAVTLNAPSFLDSGLLYVNGGTLTMDGTFSLPNTQFDSGTLNGTGAVTHNGPFVWNGGSLTGTGTTTVNAGGSLSLASGSAKLLDRALSIAGGHSATWSGGTINAGTTGSISNAGTFDITADNSMNKSAGGTPAFTNTGTLRKSGGAGGTNFTNVAINSSNTLEIQSGTLNPANMSLSGTIDLDPGTKLNIDSDVVTIAGASTFPGSGSVEVQGGTLMVSNNVTLPNFIFNSGTVDGVAMLTLGSTAAWGGGTMQGSGVTAVANGATLTMNGVVKILNARTLRPLSGSTVNWNLGMLSMSGGGNIDNTGLFHVSFDGNINNSGSAGPFANNTGGTLRKSTTAGSLTLTGVNLANNGILDIDLGKVDVSGSFVQGASGSLDILLGGVVPGTQHGQLVTNSNPAFAGPLMIAFNGPYQPLVNDDFAIVSWPSDAHTGDFAYNLPALANGRTWSSTYNASGLHLFVNAGNADLSITKTASLANVLTGHAISYTLTVNNAGPDTATSVQVTDTLPAGHTGISASGSGWTCNVVADTVTCTAASLGTGIAPGITINATAPSTSQTMTNTGTVSSSNPDPTPGNNSSNAIVTVAAPAADVELSVVNPGSVAETTAFQFVFTIKNNGPQPATNVSFSAPIPSTLGFVNATPDTGSCLFGGNTVICNVGTIPSSGSVQVIVDLTTTTDAGTHTVTATGSANESDPAAGNNTITGSVQVIGDGVVVTNTNDSGAGSLRQALLDAQSAVCTAPCLITFNIAAPPYVITPISDLPSIVSDVTIDGTSQPGFTSTPIVQLDGSLLNTAPGALILSGLGSTLRGLSITNAVNAGVKITGNNNAVVQNFIGVDPAQAAAANGVGVAVYGNNNRIGVINVSDGNVIAHNSGEGVIVAGAAVGNSIVNNNIHENGLLGIDLNDDGPTPNIAGDADSGPNNLQNFPTLTAAVLDGLGNLTVTSNIDSSATATGTILLELYKADLAGEGETLLTRTCNAGNAFTVPTTFAAGSIVAGDSIVATATAYTDGACGTVGDGTSEFSNVIVVTICTAPPATLTTPPSVCANAVNAAASVNAPTATSFNWSATNATITGGQGTNAITFNAGASGSVMLSVTVEDTNGCTNTVSNTFPINPTPVVNIAGPTATCVGTPVTLDAGNFAFYAWNTGATTQTITVSPASTQTYSVTVTDGNGCTAADSHTVTVSANPTATITTAAAVCANANGNASVASQAGATYAWTITNGTLTSPANGAAITFTAGAAGNVGLSVSVTAGSCTSSGNVTVPITATPVVNITGPASVCANTPFTLNAGAGFSSYAWSTGATTQSITVSQASGSQVYSVTVSNGGCSATDTHTVTAAGPNANITAPSSAAEHAPGLTASVPLQAGATYAWTIDNGAITAGQGTNAITFDAGDAGAGSTTINVQVTLAGCTANGFHAVSINGSSPSTADVSITKTAPATAQTGAAIVYTIGVHNAGPASVSNVNITDPLPAGTSLVSLNDGTLGCELLGNTIVCSGSLAAGATKNISITINAPSQAGTVVNVATVSGSVEDPNASNNSASASTNVTSSNTSCATAAPSLLSPLAGAELDSPVAFSWTAVAGASEYELWIVTSGGTQLAGTTTGTSLSVPLPAGAASWYVVARLNGDCGPLTSQQRAFTVRTANGCATHGAPQLTSPAANSTVVSPVTFSWMPVPQAIGYRVWIEVNGTAAQDVGTTDGAITLSADVPPGAIAAYVTALFNGCPDTQSPKIAFNVPRPDPCANRVPVTLLAPANNSIVNTSLVTFHWSDANADGYRLWLSIDGAPAEVAGTTGDTSLETTIANGSVEWWIENLYEGCGSIDSQHAHFTIPPRQNCATTAPQLIAPANGAVSSGNVTFQWSSVANAVSYELWLSANGATPTLIGSTASTSLTHLVPAGPLQWFVRAIVDRCPSVDSQTGHFVFNPSSACRDQQPPHAIAPLPNAHMTSPVDFEWSASPGATSYQLYIVRGDNAAQLIATTGNTFANGIALQTGKLRWFVRANSNCSPLESADRPLEIVPQPQSCAELATPRITMPGQISSGVPFDVQWDAIPGATAYQLQLSDSAAFTNAQLVTSLVPQHTLTRTNNGNAPVAVSARVRALDTSCKPEPTVTPYGATAAVFILPAIGVDAATPLNGGIVLHTILLESELAGQSFVVHVKEPWLSVQPSSGVVAAGGTTLTVSADTTNLPIGTSLGSVQIELNSSARGGIRTNATTFRAPTMNISKVTPVTPAPKSTPPPDALIIPAVAHASGINSLFQSDVRVTNSSAQLLQYQATFTPTGSQGLAAGRQTTFSIDPGRTIALDDVLRGWFGTGGDNVTGTLEIRPITQTETLTSNQPLSGLADLVTFASSRTFNVTSNGTFGQYIPAIPFANFIGGGGTSLSLQQIAQSDRYRTNLGIVEGSGDAASLLVKVFGSNGQMLKEIPVNLAGGQHTQLNSFLTSEVGSLSDGRVEISVIGGSGKVTAYASVLDSQTSDPLLVTPVTLTDAGHTKWVVPGVADLNNGSANWQTDMRLFNAGTTDVDATLTFYSQNGGAPHTANVTIPAGQVRQFDKALASVFGMANDGGAIHVATLAPTRLVATARTYNQTTAGTYGQFISGVTTSEAAGVGSRPLQILQVEESNRFRSNIGLAEVTGNPVTLEIMIVPPDGKLNVVTEVQLQPNEFRQIGSLLRSVGLADTYNTRVTVRATAGNGRVTAYASVIDMLTNDPTYVPAQ